MPSPSAEQTLQFLLDAPMFGDLSRDELASIVEILSVQQVENGGVVFAEGEPGDAWYVVYEGEVEVLKGAGEKERAIAILGRRACFGEMAILDGSPRSASVRARGELTVLRFARRDFHTLLRSDNLAAFKLVHQIALVLVSRQRRTTRRLVEILDAEGAERLREGLAPIVEQSSVAE